MIIVTCSQHQHSRRSVVLENNLVNNTGAGCPKFDAILGGGALEKVEYFAIGIYRALL